MVGKSMELIASLVVSTPDAIMAIAPSNAMPVLSRASPGIVPIAMPTYETMKMVMAIDCIAVYFMKRRNRLQEGRVVMRQGRDMQNEINEVK